MKKCFLLWIMMILTYQSAFATIPTHHDIEKKYHYASSPVSFDSSPVSFDKWGSYSFIAQTEEKGAWVFHVNEKDYGSYDEIHQYILWKDTKNFAFVGEKKYENTK